MSAQSTLPPLPTKSTPKLADFAIEKKIGKGQFSVVYKAIRLSDKLSVALKKIPINEIMDAKSRNDCLKEINLLKSLDHINVIKYHESFLEGNELVIVLDLADAGDLSKMIRHFKTSNQTIPEKTIWKVSSAVRHLHHRRIMHRDIKPANVFITAQGIVKLGDLGLGRELSNNTVEGIQENGYSFKSDIWSSGCLLYELAALQSPFFSDKLTLFALCKKIEKCDYPSLGPDYSLEFKELVGLMVIGDMKKRIDADRVYEVAKKMYENSTRLNREASKADDKR